MLSTPARAGEHSLATRPPQGPMGAGLRTHTAAPWPEKERQHGRQVHHHHRSRVCRAVGRHLCPDERLPHPDLRDARPARAACARPGSARATPSTAASTGWWAPRPRAACTAIWQEVGIAQGREFVNMDEYMRYEGADGRTFILYTDVDRLEKHMLEFSPQDAEPTREFIQGIRLASPSTSPPNRTRRSSACSKGIKLALAHGDPGPGMQKWMKITAAEFAARFKDPRDPRGTGRDVVPGILHVLHALHLCLPAQQERRLSHRRLAAHVAGPGEALPATWAATSTTRAAWRKSWWKADKAVGVRLADGSEHRAGRVISAADGHTTIFKMLDGKYADDKTREPYEKWPIFPPLLFVGVGVNRSFADEPQTVSGISFALRQPTEIGDAVHDRLPVHIFNQDPTLAPRRQDQPGGDAAQQVRVLEGAGAGPGGLRGEEGPGGAHGGGAAGPALPRHRRAGGDGGCGHAADL